VKALDRDAVLHKEAREAPNVDVNISEITFPPTVDLARNHTIICLVMFRPGLA
jgi:hypothetical protein